MSLWLNSSVADTAYRDGHQDSSSFLDYFISTFNDFSTAAAVQTVYPSTKTPRTSIDFFDGFQESLIGSGEADSNNNFAYMGGNGTRFSNESPNYAIESENSGDGDYFVNQLLTTADLSISLSATTENYGGIVGASGNIDSSSGFLELQWIFDKKNLRHSVGWTIALIIAYMLILIIGIIGNCMVILVVLLRPQMRTVTNMFIMNLATADLFVIMFCVPATLLANLLNPWILGSFMCKGVAYVQGVSVCASAYSLVAISLDRCKAIYRPMERPRGLSKSQALFTICLIWVCALIMTLPWAIVFDVIKSDKDRLTYCVETWRNEQHGKVYFLVANLIFCYTLPLILISLSNVVIWCHVSRRKVPQDSAAIGTIKRMHRRTRHGVRKMLGIVTLAFLISWLPLYVLATRVKFSSSESETEASILAILLPFAQWLGSWNSCINPVLYAFLNSKFRESFKSLLPSWMPLVMRKPRTNVITNGTIVGTTGTPSYTTVYTARSSGRSSCNSRNSRRHHHHHNKNNFHHHITLLVSNDRATTTATTRATTTINASAVITDL